MKMSRRKLLGTGSAAAALAVTGPALKFVPAPVVPESVAMGMNTVLGGMSLDTALVPSKGIDILNGLRRFATITQNHHLETPTANLEDFLPERRVARVINYLFACARECRNLEELHKAGISLSAVLDTSDARVTALATRQHPLRLEVAKEHVLSRLEGLKQWVRYGEEGAAQDLRAAARRSLRAIAKNSLIGDEAIWEQCDTAALLERFYTVESVEGRCFVHGALDEIRYIQEHAGDALPQQCRNVLGQLEAKLLAEPVETLRPAGNAAAGADEEQPLTGLPAAEPLPALPAPSPVRLVYQLLEPPRATAGSADMLFQEAGAVIETDGVDAERIAPGAVLKERA